LTLRISLAEVWPIAAPAAFLILGALIGLPFSRDRPIAMERLVGLIAASLLAIAAMFGLRRMHSSGAVLIGLSAVALAASVWVIAATGPDVFRGSLGTLLDRVLGGLFYKVNLTAAVAEANTWFIVGYNGVIDLSLMVIFACGAVAVEQRRSAKAIPLVLLVVLGLVLLVGAGARGGLTGLAAGVCLIGLYVWPRRYAVLAFVAAPVALALAALSIFDKGLEFSSTAGRFTYWADLARLLGEYPLTGVGLGVDTANAVALQYGINPDPERIFYAHNTFVQSYLEQGPVGLFGMLLLPALVIVAALLARRQGLVAGHRALLVTGLGVVGAMEAHGLTDQVVTTNIGTLVLLLGSAAVFASLRGSSLRRLSRWTVRASVGVSGAAVLLIMLAVALPLGRAQLLLNLGGLEMNAALSLGTQSPERAGALGDAESVLSLALDQDPSHPGVLRDLAWVRSARYDDSGALSALNAAAQSPRIDAFDMLQIAHVYRDLGATDEAYTWATRAYSIWGRSEEDVVMGTYAQATLSEPNARTLAEQAEAAMRARHFGDAHTLFEQALTFEPSSSYLQSRIGASQRAIDKYGA
jgi:O-Antigen ligase